MRATAARLRRREVTALELADAALAAAQDAQPATNAFAAIDHDGARRAAARADRELARGEDRGPLHGIPVAVKDLIDTAGVATEMGSRQFAGRVPNRDAGCVAALRAAGCVIVAKTTTHEVAYGPTGDVTATGPVRNPRDPRRMAGGSSAGSAAAVAAGVVALALGTDTGGSVRIPAALCAVAGLRPSPGRVARDGVLELARSLDEVGPLAAGIDDLGLALVALTGAPRRVAAPEAAAADLRVGVVEHPWLARVDPEVGAAFGSAVDALADAGAAVRPVPVGDLEALSEVYRLVQSREAVAVHAERLARAPDRFEPETLERLRTAAAVPPERSGDALRQLGALRMAARDRLAGMDVLALPTVPILAPPVGDRSPQPGGWSSPREALLAFTAPWSVLGLPCLSLPLGEASLQLVGAPGADEALLAAGRAVERVLDR